MARPSPSSRRLGYGALVLGTAAIALAAWRLYRNQEKIMADFEGLDADIDTLRSEVAATATRVEKALEKLLDDTADQEQIAEARAEVQEAVAALKAIAPAPPIGGPAEPTEEPAGPTEPAEPGSPV